MRRIIAMFLTTVILTLTLPTLAQGNLADIVASDAELSTLYESLMVADPELLQTITATGSYTLLAPTNAAFIRVSDFLDIPLDKLVSDADVMTAILQYHIIEGAKLSTQLEQSSGQVISTLLPGAFIGIGQRDNGTLVFNSAGDVLRADISASNGVIHVIDDVLLNRVINESIIALQTRIREETTSVETTPEPTATATATPEAVVETPVTSPEEAQVMTQARLAHLAPGAPSVDGYINGAEVVEGVIFGNISTLVDIPAEIVEVALVPADGVIDDAVLTETLTFHAENTATIVVVENLAGELSFTVIDELKAPIDGISARITFFNASEKQVDLQVNTVLFTRLGFNNSFTIDFPLGDELNNYELELLISDPAAPEAEVMVLPLDLSSLETGIYLYAITNADEPLLVIALAN